MALHSCIQPPFLAVHFEVVILMSSGLPSINQVVPGGRHESKVRAFDTWRHSKLCAVGFSNASSVETMLFIIQSRSLISYRLSKLLASRSGLR